MPGSPGFCSLTSRMVEGVVRLEVSGRRRRMGRRISFSVFGGLFDFFCTPYAIFASAYSSAIHTPTTATITLQPRATH